MTSFIIYNRNKVPESLVAGSLLPCRLLPERDIVGSIASGDCAIHIYEQRDVYNNLACSSTPAFKIPRPLSV